MPVGPRLRGAHAARQRGSSADALASLFEELVELSRDVSGDPELRRRRVAVLRRIERLQPPTPGLRTA